MISVALFGIGRAGGEVVKEIATSGQFHLCAVFCRDGSPKAGQPVSSLLQIGELGVRVSELSQAPRVLEETKPDVCVDFSNHACAAAILSACAPQKIPCVLCTTGFAAEELEELSAFVLQNDMGAVYAPNVTLGVNVLIAAIKVVARALPVSLEDLFGADEPAARSRRGPVPKWQQQIEAVAQLPKAQQCFVSQMLETVLCGMRA